MGYDYSQLEKECKRLRASGFTVSILNGGLNYWRQNGGTLDGDPFAQKGLNKISPRIFFQEKGFEHRIVIDASKIQKPESKHLIPYAVHIPFSDEPKGSNSFIQSLRPLRLGGEPVLPALIFNEDGRQYERIEKAVKKSGLKNVFYLKGGLKEYKDFLQHLTLLRAPKDTRVKTLKRCKSCGDGD